MPRIRDPVRKVGSAHPDDPERLTPCSTSARVKRFSAFLCYLFPERSSSADATTIQRHNMPFVTVATAIAATELTCLCRKREVKASAVQVHHPGPAGCGFKNRRPVPIGFTKSSMTATG